VQGLEAIKLRRGTFAFAAAALALLAVLAARGGVSPAAAGTTALTAIEVETLDQPTYAQRPPGEPDLLAVTEKGGEIEMLRDEDALPDPFLDITDLVSETGEQGLLSIAFHPQYRKNRRFYVYYTDNNGDIRVDEFKRKKGDPEQASEASRRRVIRIDHPASATNHNGGTVFFGKNGHMWLATGDGGADHDTAVDIRNQLLGKVLRIEAFKPNDPNKPGYKVPKQNPFVGKRGDDEIWGYGFRNPFRFSIDYATETIAIADVGEVEREEVNVRDILSNRGGNYGWPRFEGTLDFDTGAPTPHPHKPPMYEYAHDGGGDAITGGLVVHDPELPSLAGKYLFADFYAGDVIAFTPDLANNEADGLAPIGVDILNPVSIVSANGGDPGQTYITALSGGVYRLEPGP
jgi:glucose/arabinose dehydrogenase